MAQIDFVRLAALGTAGVAALVTSAAAAQTAEPAASDIIVTAQKREQKLQDVPISIQAFSSRQLDNVGISNTYDLAIVTPGLQFSQNGAAPTAFIRGIGFQDASVGQESPIATYIDGVYHPLSFVSAVDLEGIERVEVLKGPQGTLFGRNATGGLISIVTRDPSMDAVTGEVKVQAGNYERFGGSAYLSTPLGEGLAANLTVQGLTQGKGYGRNVNPVRRPGFDGRDVYFTRNLLGRTKFKWQGDATTITLSADYLKRTGDQSSRRILPGALGLDGQPGPDGYYDTLGNITDRIRIESYGGSARLEHDFGGVALLGISGYRHDRVHNNLDLDQTAAQILDAVPVRSLNDSFTQEVQLRSSDSASPFQWTAGLFYLHSKATIDVTLQGAGLGGLDFLNFRGTIKTSSYSAFGEASYDITDRLGVTAGIRFTRDERRLIGIQHAAIPGAPIIDTPSSGRKTFEKVTYRGVLNYRPADDILAYASINRGFKSGNFGAASIFDAPFAPEVVDAYEIGLKSQWLDRRLTVNLAGFYYDYSNMQVTIQEGPALKTENAASAELYGLDLDVNAVVNRNLTLFGGLALLRSRYKKYLDATVYAPSGAGGNILLPPGTPETDLSGNRLPRSPSTTFNIGGTLRVPTAVGELSATAVWYHNGGFYWQGDNRLRQRSYSLLNVTSGWTSRDEHFGARIKVANLLDKKYCADCGGQAVSDYLTPAAPRTFLVELRARF